MANNQQQGSSISMFALAAACAWGAWSVPNDAAQWFLGATGAVAVIAGRTGGGRNWTGSASDGQRRPPVASTARRRS